MPLWCRQCGGELLPIWNMLRCQQCGREVYVTSNIGKRVRRVRVRR